MTDYPSDKLKTEVVPASKGHEGAVTDKNIEGRGPEAETIRGNSRVSNKKSAGNVGASNVNI